MTDIERQVKALANANWLNGFAAGVLIMSIFSVVMSIVVRSVS